MGYLQNLPTKYWNEDDLELLVAEAYAFQNMYSKKESN